MSVKARHNTLIARLFVPYLLLVISVLVIVTCSCFQVAWDSDNQYSFTTGWTLADGTPADTSDIEDDISFFNTLPTLSDSDVLFFRAKNIIVSVYIDGELIVNYDDIEMQSALHYKAPGTYYPQINLNSDFSGKQIELRVISPYKHDSSCGIKYLQIGESTPISRGEILKRLPSFCVCIIIIAIGIIFIIISRFFSRFNVDNHSLLYLGVFAAIIGVWSLTEMSFLQLLLGHSTFWHLITGLTLPLLIAPIFFFFKRRYKGTDLFPMIIENVMTVAVYITSVILHFTDIADLHELISLAHLVIITGAIFTLYYAIRCFIASRFKDHSFLGMLILAILAVVDLVLYKLQLVMDSSTFTRIGIFAYIGFLGIEIIRDYVKAYNLYLKSEILSKAAYYDMLTEFFNRTSYIEDTKAINANKKYGIVIVVFDMNNLKYINDVYGHTSGDGAIIESSQFIKDAFWDLGRCYRIGGDEFVFISESQKTSPQKIHERLAGMNAKLYARNSEPSDTKPFPLLIAAGVATFSEDQSDFSTAFRLADEQMYSNKQKLKQQYPEMNLRK